MLSASVDSECWLCIKLFMFTFKKPKQLAIVLSPHAHTMTHTHAQIHTHKNPDTHTQIYIFFTGDMPL